MKRTFTLEYWIDDGWYVGALREVPGVYSQAETLEELRENIREVYHLMREEKSFLPAGETKVEEIGVEV